MLSFKQYLSENNMNAHQDLHDEVDAHIANGKIPNPRFEELKDKIQHRMQKVGREHDDVNWAGKGPEYAKHPHSDKLWDLGHLHYEGLSKMSSLGKKLQKHKEIQDHPVYTSAKEFHSQFAPLVDKMKQLKGMIVSNKQVQAEKKEKKAEEFKKTYGDTSHLQKVLLQHKEEHGNRAHKIAGEIADSAIEHLKKHDWDLNKAAPRAKHGNSAWAQHAATSHRNHLSQFVSHDHERNRSVPYSSNEDRPYYVKHTPEKKEKYQDEARKHAHHEFDAYVHKMTEKIGKPTTHAEMHGDPWTGSELHVTTHDGEKQHWNTKMIINRSKYNTLFHQFPSRRKS